MNSVTDRDLSARSLLKAECPVNLSLAKRGDQMTGNRALGTMFGAGGVSTFMGIPACPDPETIMGGIALIGADGCTPYPSVGFYCAGGPAAIRAAGAAYAANLSHMNFDLGGPVFPSGVTAAISRSESSGRSASVSASSAS